MLRHPQLRTRLVLSVAAAAALGLSAAACGSSNDTQSVDGGSSTTADDTTTATAPTTAAAAPLPTPSVVGAASVPLVTGPQKSKPTVAKPSGTPPTTLLEHDVIGGTGATATAGSTVQMNYSLYLYSTGALVQSSYDNGGQPFQFTIDATPEQVIPGFDAGAIGMKVGGRRELIIPPSLGYGSTDQNGIPANSTLIFVVDLVSVG